MQVVPLHDGCYRTATPQLYPATHASSHPMIPYECGLAGYGLRGARPSRTTGSLAAAAAAAAVGSTAAAAATAAAGSTGAGAPPRHYPATGRMERLLERFLERFLEAMTAVR
jgi:hypothetical protein